MSKFKDLSIDEILQLVGCPNCKLSKVYEDEPDFKYILETENLLTLLPEQISIWVNCVHCNKVYLLDCWINSEYPRIRVTPLNISIEEYIEYLNKEYSRVEGFAERYPFKLEDYIKK